MLSPLIQIAPIDQLSPAQREAAAAILVRALSQQPATWRTPGEARAEVATFLEGHAREKARDVCGVPTTALSALALAADRVRLQRDGLERTTVGGECTW